MKLALLIELSCWLLSSRKKDTGAAHFDSGVNHAVVSDLTACNHHNQNELACWLKAHPPERQRRPSTPIKERAVEITTTKDEKLDTGVPSHVTCQLQKGKMPINQNLQIYI